MEKSPPHSPFAWIAYSGDEIAMLDEVKSGMTAPASCFASRQIAALPLEVAVGKNDIWITERGSGKLIRVVRFDEGFPSFDPAWSEYGNRLRLAISPSGFLAFYRNENIYSWNIDTNAVQLLGHMGGTPNEIVISPKGGRVAAVRQGSRGRWFGWIADVWSLADGAHLATLRWHAIYPGTYSSLNFSGDGDILFLSTEVSAQSGSDFEENHGWDIGAGPE